MLIGLTGRKQSGKSEVADHLAAAYDFRVISLADPLRAMLLAVDPWVEEGLRLSVLIRMVGWDAAKEGWPEVRRLLQQLGTEGVRDVIGPDTWVDLMAGSVREARDLDPSTWIVVPDVRFPNEADAVRALGGVVVRVDRPGMAGPLSDHASETEMHAIRADAVLQNTGSLDDLRARALGLIFELPDRSELDFDDADIHQEAFSEQR